VRGSAHARDKARADKYKDAPKNIEMRLLHGRGCGSLAGRDQVEMIVKMIGLSKSELLQLCPQVRTTIG
jgi:hypothetical protein